MMMIMMMTSTGAFVGGLLGPVGSANQLVCTFGSHVLLSCVPVM
jgi:hypothetical protein